MRNNHFFKTQILLAALAAALITPFFAFAQQKPASRTTTIKDSDIPVPDKVLEPSYTKEEASELLKAYIAAFSDSDMPRSYEVFAKNPEKYKRIGSRQLKSALGNLYNYVKDPDIQEVTGASDNWFKNLYNKALELNEPAALMDKAIRLQNAAMYSQALNEYVEKCNELKNFTKKKPERLSPEALKRITETNKANRKKEYIALQKQYLLERQAAAEEELKKISAPSSKRK